MCVHVCTCVCFFCVYVCVLGELLMREREGEVRERKSIEDFCQYHPDDSSEPAQP